MGLRYLLYLGIPSFLNIHKEEGLSVSSSTLAIGVLVLEVLLALTVILWGYGSIGVLVLEVLLALTVILWGYGYRLF